MWSSLPVATRRSLMQTAIQQARDVAATSIMLSSQGSPHDIIKAATDAKTAQLQSQPTQPPTPDI